MRIVVVDDEPVSRALISKMLRAMGHSTIQLSEGHSACDVLENNGDVHMLVTDIQMPNMSGIELIEIVRSQPRKKYLPILAVSGMIAMSTMSEALEVGADRFLPKPIKKDALSAYVRDLAKMRLKESPQVLQSHTRAS